MSRGDHFKLGCIVVLLGVAIALLSDGTTRTVHAFSSGPLPGNTGAPGEQTCANCHSSSGGLVPGTLTIDVPPIYQPGNIYEIRVRSTSTDLTRRRWGFQLTVLTADNQKAGDLQLEEDTNQILNNVGPGGNRQYVEHNLQGTFNGKTGGAVWYFYWAAPLQNVGPVTFYAAGNQANGDFDSTGDDILTTSVVSQPPSNPVDDASFFVTQQYLDFLDRGPDPEGLAYWKSQITSCQSSIQCIQQKRAEVSAAFFFSTEFQLTAFFDNRVYQIAYGRPPTYPEFVSDMSTLGLGSGGDLTVHRTTFIEGFTNSANFLGLYAVLQNATYVDTLTTKAGISLTAAERTALITGLNNGTETRGSVLAKLADNEASQASQFNAGFVLLEYFGYLRRYPDDEGFAFWLGKLNQPGGNATVIDMIKFFITSAEYRQRFGPA
jgi:hypothetical protein